MKWKGREKSSNINDRRGARSYSSGGVGAAALLRFVPLIYRILGFKGLAALAVVGGIYFYYQGGFPLNALSSDTSENQSAVVQSEEEKQQVDFISVILRDTEITWEQLFQKQGNTYKQPTLVLYRGSTSSACGAGSAAMGPFYCPADQHIYIDLSFYDELASRHGAPGDFAQAYVLAHEVGHHVQTLLGISSKVYSLKSKSNEVVRNQLSVMQELQADCFAGIWGFYAKNNREMLDQGDLEEALVAAAAIGDDTLQRQAQGKVVPDSFTHGSADQRKKWFQIGFNEGSINACNTFNNL